MIGGVQPKVLLTQEENGNLKMDDEMGKLLFGETQMNWKLVRERDGLTKQSNGIKWLEWNEDGSFKEQFEEVTIGRSLLMSPFNQYFTWQTTTVTEIVEQREDYIKFKTENSNYELFKI
tara:strand:- start:147 stop:503 length:357 start_codon:yes stop_codon:yes gene_type:complete